VELIEVAGGWQILTRPEFTEVIERAQLAARPQRLSAAALETLAIIAYRQPIGRAEIEEIRGVGAGQMLKSLHDRELIEVVGRGEGMGRPLLYGTTPGFLEQFALRHLGELPRADELAIALRDPDRPDATRDENGAAPSRAAATEQPRV
jgi:segregation and condensation protein B